MKFLAFILLLLSGCATVPPAPVVAKSATTPPMPATVQQSLMVQRVPQVSVVPTVQPSHFTGNIYLTFSTNETCHWEAIQGSDDGATWTNECVFLTADDVVTNLTFTNSTPHHFWRYVFRP